MLIDNGGSSFLDGKDFTEQLDPTNEQLVVDFLLERLENNMNKLKSMDKYNEKVAQLTEKPIETIADYNQLNSARLHIDEYEVLKKNYSHLSKMRQKINLTI